MVELTELHQNKELEAQIGYGNHKLVRAKSDKVSQLLAKDAQHGFAILLPVDAVKKLKGVAVQPCGVVKQFLLSANRTKKLKARLTHDLSHPLT